MSGMETSIIVNTMEEQRYPTRLFFNRSIHFPIPQDGVPSLEGLLTLCRSLSAYIDHDPENVVAVHSKNGNGRSVLILTALLLYRGVCKTVTSALAVVEHKRQSPESRGLANLQTTDCESQRRFLQYFSHICHTKERTGAFSERPS